ncbi:MAG: class I SAM-dependent methyltransferase [Candidatus Dormibacteria bacterium]
MHLQGTDQLRSCQYRAGANLAARQRRYRHHGQTAAPWQSFVFQQLRLPAQSRIMEIGCGPGALWQANLERIPCGWRVTLSDLSPGMLAEAESALLGISLQPTMRLDDARRLPVPDGQLRRPDRQSHALSRA